MNIVALRSKLFRHYLLVQEHRETKRKLVRDFRSGGSLPNFFKCDKFFVARYNFTANEKFFLH